MAPDTVPAETLLALLRDYAAARWPVGVSDDEAVMLTADPVYGGDPVLVAALRAAFAAGRASVLDGAEEEWGLRRIGTAAVTPGHTEKSAREYAQVFNELEPGAVEVVRSVCTPWQPAGEPGAPT